MGVAQHHDAVSGTEKQEVAFDYAQRLSVGIDNAVVSIEIIPFLSLNFKHKLTNTYIKSFEIKSMRFCQYSKITVDLPLCQIKDYVNKTRSYY